MAFHMSTDQALLPQEEREESKILTKNSRKAEWKISLALFLPIIVSTGFAVGHHYYLASLHEGPVGGVESQRTVKAINNTFPTIISSMLCISLATAILELVCAHTDISVAHLTLSVTVLAQSKKHRFTSDVKADRYTLQSSFFFRGDMCTKGIRGFLLGLFYHSRLLSITSFAYICTRSIDNRLECHDKY
ncbi:hypothetical protein CPB86DRAFT_117638 [Serendipita vermifera]|nr:hypothetical protein CPB86DRAFT_117638 [Serendipita vermifera]